MGYPGTEARRSRQTWVPACCFSDDGDPRKDDMVIVSSNTNSVNGEGSGSSPDPGVKVNLRGVPLSEAKATTTVTISLLSEGTHHCDECQKEIPGLAAYHTRPRPGHRDGWELVALTCPECVGHDGRAA